MELTAEQKYLKALAEWLDIETIPKNRIQEASREYLDQFVGVNEKVNSHSIENLHHFNCSCGQWWTIGDFDNSFEPMCPRCGKAFSLQVNDQFTDVSKKVEPEWKPEVGKLYKRTLNGVVTEITNLKSDRVYHILQGFDYDPDIENCYHEDYIIDFIKEYEPIAELEGLKEGDYVVSTHCKKIQKRTYKEMIKRIEITSCFTIVYHTNYGERYDVNGIALGHDKHLSGYYRLFRTVERAERFGRGDA